MKNNIEVEVVVVFRLNKTTELDEADKPLGTNQGTNIMKPGPLKEPKEPNKMDDNETTLGMIRTISVPTISSG